MKTQQENNSQRAEQLVPQRDIAYYRWCPTHSNHQYACNDMNRYHKNLVLVHLHFYSI
jgi:hypothetical protein